MAAKPAGAPSYPCECIRIDSEIAIAEVRRLCVDAMWPESRRDVAGHLELLTKIVFRLRGL